MEGQEEASKRTTRLTQLFHAVIHGHRELKSAPDCSRFLEALCAHEEASKAVENLIAAPTGLSAIAKAFRVNSDVSFVNGPATSALLYLSHPSLKQLYGGQFLTRVLEQIVQPPTFWNTFAEAHHAKLLSDNAEHAFAWLLLEILCCRSEEVPDVRDVAERVTEFESLTNSTSLNARNLGHKIKHVLSSTSLDSVDGPGGRHDNDFADYRQIRILPSADEFASNAHPFYRRADGIESVQPEMRGLSHLDNQFRLLREDLLGELRSDFHIATGQKKGRRKVFLTDLKFCGLDCGLQTRRRTCAIQLECTKDIPQMSHLKQKQSRKKYVSENKNMLKHQSLGCLISDAHIVAFASVERDEDLLSKTPPIVVLRIAGPESFRKTLIVSKITNSLQFVQVDTPVFAYEPILECLKSMNEIPLQDQLLNLAPESTEALSGIQPQSVLQKINDNRGGDLQHILGTTKSIALDPAQEESLLSGLAQRVSLIQGPPGTGKSFIGALIARLLHDHTNETILVLTYTNHALDQYLGELQNIGIPQASIVRLGSKASPNTKNLSLRQQPNDYKMSAKTHHIVQDQKSEAEGYHDHLLQKTSQFHRFTLNEQTLLDYLELSEDSKYFDAFSVPENHDGMTKVGKKGKKLNKFYLVNQWLSGKDAGVFRNSTALEYPEVWKLNTQARNALLVRWHREMLEEQATDITSLAQKFDKCCERIDQLFREKRSHVIGQKRIIGCTTTGAAMFSEELKKASPGVVLVEEAGEILESHVLTAMSPNTKQLILIGDHKQLRPKVNNYSLTIEKGDGYNLNVSLFERLVVAGVPHTTLNKQHRMRPEISSLVKSLTYPELEDAENTKSRPALRGFQDNVIFVSHHHPEINADKIAERRDQGAKSSKENDFEAEMVLKCVRYLGQQGYGNDDIVVLTPYLGQLFLLMRTLANENDPILNDLDQHELIRAGLLSPAGANISKRKIRISTIDNYQGEESDIVITCLTRSNSVGDVGFMAAPQRVNVLLSRARNGLVMIGNADTFMKSRNGGKVWVPLMDQLKTNGHVYDGFPVKCEQHPDKAALIDVKEQWDLVCPDGGCSEPCGEILSCKSHACPRRCHKLGDHSKMKCEAIVKSTCPNKHQITRKCHNKANCPKCEHEARAKEKKRQRDFKLDQERRAKQQAYAVKLAEIDDQIEYQKRLLKDQIEENDRNNAMSQKISDLASLKKRAHVSNSEKLRPELNMAHPTQAANSCSDVPSSTEKTPGTTSMPEETKSSTSAGSVSSIIDNSEAKNEWEHAKKFEAAENEALDSLMAMIGLESVKQQFLDIKTDIDTKVRQNVSLKGERFGAALLGNPGTGKTTVARLYAKFLFEVGALPGEQFLETSGAALANDGVSACKSQIDKILEEGGGVFFIDETYQLISGNSYGGKAVLDYLLAEIENLTGKIVFVLAGYNKNMEAFFSHNPGISSRIPLIMEFQDYEDEELQQILCHYINTKYQRQMKIEGGMKGLYVRILCRRIGSGRGRDGFGNAREVQNKVSQIVKRQGRRLREKRKAGQMPDDFLLTKEDLIGPEPSSVTMRNEAWGKLQSLIGLQSVKQSVQALLDGIQYNYQRELDEKPLVKYSLNKCFIGSPGTGKTTVAKLYGRILADIGLLSNGEVVVKNPADFVGNVLGQSESNTKAILASTVGKVLIIDEAYMLAGSSTADPYKSAVIDTIVAQVQSVPGEDRCVLLLGYKDQMEEMFRDVNPGLARRFPLESAFTFEDFTDPELRKVLDLKLKDVGYGATDQAKRVAMEMLQRARNRPNFGNAGEVDILLDKAKALHQKHLSTGKTKKMDTFEAIDFDPDFDRGERAATNLPQLFQDVVGSASLIKQFQGYQSTAANMKALGMDPREQIPFNFLFKGPPGTGKTTTAQKMGKIFYDMGFLSQAKVVECSATDLIGQYVGQTGPKVQQLLEKAMGKVLFIDEAYRLAEGGFATEAMDELVDCLTKPKFAQRLVTILAGYDHDMDRLMNINPGLTSRFPESVIFHHLRPDVCLELLTKILSDLQKRKNAPLDISILTMDNALSTSLRETVTGLFDMLSSLKSWGNARDVKSLAKGMFGKLISGPLQPGAHLVLTEDIILETMTSMLAERTQRSEAANTTRFPGPQALMPEPQAQRKETTPAPRTPEISTNKTIQPPPEPGEKKAASNPEEAKTTKPSASVSNAVLHAKRDPGVCDAIWQQLEQDKRAQVAREKAYRQQQEEQRREEARIAELIRAEKRAADDEERRRLEAEWVAAEQERRRQEEERAALEKERERERKAQQKLRQMGVCCMGFAWIRQASGYRCAGGSHYVSDGALNLG